VFGLVESHLKRIGLHFAQTLAAARLEGLERHIAELIEVAECEQPVAHGTSYAATPTDTHFESAEIGISHGHIRAQIAHPVTMRAVWVAEQIGDGLSRRRTF